jgi:hypothetical protein
MACNCGKNRQPTGYGQARQQGSEQPSAGQQDETRSRAAATANANRLGSPAPTGMTQSFQLQARDGSTQSFGSKLEADAARVRAGGGEIRAL